MDPAALDLRDIHLPAEPGWWPPAIGWWLLLALLLAAAVFAWLRWRRHRAERVRRAALAALEGVVQRCGGEPDCLTGELSVWLRRVALSVGARREVAGLTGEAWLAALQRLSPASRLPRDYGHLLTEGPYRSQVPADARELDGLVAACREWTLKLELAE